MRVMELFISKNNKEKLELFKNESSLGLFLSLNSILVNGFLITFVSYIG